MIRSRLLLLCLLLVVLQTTGQAQKQIVTVDSVVYHIMYRDTVVYRYDTVRIKRYIKSDTLWSGEGATALIPATSKKKGWYNPSAWGIGPSVGAYYSPFHGFDLNVGFGVQYYLFAVPSFRNPHMGAKRKKK
jgi:hypothetical protein